METLTVAQNQAQDVPQPASAPKLRDCPNCGGPYSRGPRGTRRFCSTPCQVEFNNRLKAEGMVIVALAKAWRKGRGKAGVPKAAFSELCTILDHFNAQDVKAGRGSILDYADQLLKSGSYLERCT